jgi:cell division protein FtsI (penicillin-binding protein 3)
LALPGEGIPRIPQPHSKYWSGVTLPQLSYGYESLITPLQTLTLYNAIANDGRMVKPRFVKEIRRNGIVVKKYDTEVLIDQIVKRETLAKAKLLLEGVVNNGSGKTLNITAFHVGGKTGTAQIAKLGPRKGSGKTAYGDVGDRSYQASFVGYFPAENPLYTCIVVINSPSNGVYYGAAVAGPVFKEIAEKVYSSSLNCITPINNRKNLITHAPTVGAGSTEALTTVTDFLSLPLKGDKSSNYVRREYSDSSSVKVYPVQLEAQLKKGIMPNLSGLSAKDALFLLENNGVFVRLQGIGAVRKQSIEAGTRFSKGNKITLTLSQA